MFSKFLFGSGRISGGVLVSCFRQNDQEGIVPSVFQMTLDAVVIFRIGPPRSGSTLLWVSSKFPGPLS